LRATTAHRAQGSTVDRAFVLGSDELHREWGYTAMSRHRDEARFYVTAPAPYLNTPARSLTRQEELVETVARLFENSEQQELALEALERTPGAAALLARMDDTADRATNAAQRAAELEAERDATSRLHRGQRRDLEHEAGRFRGVARHHQAELASLSQDFELRARAAFAPTRSRPTLDRVDLHRLRQLDRDLDLDLDR
jgi:hypothetical protein